MFKKIALKISILSISVLIGLLICEFLIRILPIKNIDRTRQGYFRSHLTRGFEYTPNISTKFGGYVDWNINSKGFRDYEHKVEKENFRILALGDSYFVGHEVSFEDSFLRQLEKGLGVEVIRMAVGAYGTIEERLLWEEEGIKYNPDLVLLGVYSGNDLHDNAGFPNRACVHNGELIGCSYDLSSYRIKIALYLAERSLFAKFLLMKFKTFLLPEQKSNQTNHSEPNEEDAIIRYDESVVQLYQNKWSWRLQKGFELLKKNILRLNASVLNNNATLIVIVIPLESQIYDWQWEEYAKRKSLDPSKHNKYKVIELLVDFLKSNHIRFINLLPILKEAGKTDRNLHPDHWHWSVKANKLVADAVQGYSEENQLTPPIENARP